MIIRPYELNDESRCLEIFDSNCPKYFAEHEREEFKEALQRTEKEPYFVVEVSGEIIGCGGVFYDSQKKVCGLSWGMVHNLHHGKGHGEKLARYRLALLSAQFPDCKQLVNTAQYTEAFYKKFGFKTNKVIKDGWGLGLDKYEMEK